ncbi:MAG: hypothetical protein O7C66_04295 [Alphaproteobacteria bacterium]|nr:hypothetical protein [Alphaproteobacteria bacterium]
MGLGWRVFAFEDDGTMRRIPQRVVNDDEALPEYADKVVRIAWVWLELEGGVPVGMLNVEAYKWRFDGEGRRSKIEDMRRAADVLSQPIREYNPPPRQDGVIDISRKLLEEKHFWEPTPADITRMVNFIWKPGW